MIFHGTDRHLAGYVIPSTIEASVCGVLNLLSKHHNQVAHFVAARSSFCSHCIAFGLARDKNLQFNNL